MKYYCKTCQKLVNEDAQCSCGGTFSPTIEESEIRPFIQKLHKKTNDCRHALSHYLSFIVIGLTIAIIGFLFYYLSFSLVTVEGSQDKVYVVNTACSEFWVSMVALGVGGILFLVGAVLGTITSCKESNILFTIDSIRSTGSLEYKNRGLLAFPLFHWIWKKCRHLVWYLKRTDQSKLFLWTDVLLAVGKVLNIIFAIVYLPVTILMFALAPSAPDQSLKTTVIVLGIVFLLYFIMCCVLATIITKLKEKFDAAVSREDIISPSIVAIVVGGLSTPLVAVAGILMLCTRAKHYARRKTAAEIMEGK